MIRRDFQSHAVVGAVIRGYERFAQDVRAGPSFDFTRANEEGLQDEVQALLNWQQ